MPPFSQTPGGGKEGQKLSSLGETEALLVASLHCFLVGVPGVGGFGPATIGVGA